MHQAFRQLRSQPLIAVAVLLTLAVAIGANTAVFSVIHAVLVKPLPYPHAERIAVLWTDDPEHNIQKEGVSYPNFTDWRAMNQSFESMAFFVRPGGHFTQVNLATAGIPERLQAGLVSEDFFSVMGVAPLRGRTFSAAEERASTTVVISEGVWQRWFGGAENAIGGKVSLDGSPHTVIGVMPARFRFPTGDTQVWLPYSKVVPYQSPRRTADAFVVLGRMKPGLRMEQVRSDMDRVGERLKQAHPDMDEDFAGFGVSVFSLFEHIYGNQMRPALLMLFGAVGAVLLVACANVASLLLARAEGRRREFALRTALGAGLRDLWRQVFAESLLLSGAGTIAAIALAFLSLRILQAWLGAQFPWLASTSIEWPVLLFAAAIAIGVAFVCGLAPLASAARRQPGEILQEQSRSSESRPSRSVKRGLIVAEIAVAVMLLAAGGLLLRSFLNVQHVPLGYQPEKLLVLDLVNRSYGFSKRDERSTHGARVWRQLVEKIQALPGVKGVAVSAGMFVAGRNPDWMIAVEEKGVNAVRENRGPLIDDIVSSNYFEVMGVRLLEGRSFTKREEQEQKLSVAVINQTMAKKWWPDGSALGKRFTVDAVRPGRQWTTVIGVVEDMRLHARDVTPIPQMFLRISDYPDPKLVVRSMLPPESLIPAIRSALRTIDKEALIYRTTTVERNLDEMMAHRKLQTVLIGVFAMLALLLAAFGVAALLHYSVSRRRREFGIRTAVGATAGDLARLVLGESFRLAAVGVVLGVPGALSVSRVLQSFLYGVQPDDPGTLAGSVTLLLVTVLLAAGWPAWRGAQVDPLTSLRHE